jgi:hypothetical protein
VTFDPPAQAHAVAPQPPAADASDVANCDDACRCRADGRCPLNHFASSGDLRKAKTTSRTLAERLECELLHGRDPVRRAKSFILCTVYGV